MLIIHMTEGCSTDNYTVGVQTGPYYYRYVTLKGPDGTEVRVNGYLGRSFRFGAGTQGRYERFIGRMNDQPWTSPWSVLDPDYPLKEDRLHQCIHEHVDGEAVTTAANVKFQPQVECDVVIPNSQYYEIIELDHKGERRVTLPTDFTPAGKYNTVTTQILPHQVVRSVIFQEYIPDDGNVHQKVLFADETNEYLGLGSAFQDTLPDKELFVGVRHIFQNNEPVTQLYYYYHDVYVQNLFWNRHYSVVTLPGLYSIHSEGFWTLVKDSVPKRSAFSDRWTNWSNLQFASLNGEFVKADSDCILDILRDRYWNESIRSDANALSAAAYQQALLGEKALDINSIMYLQDFGKIGELMRSYTALIKTGVNPRTVSGAFLASWYGVRLTVKDTKKIIRSAKQYKRHVEQDYDYTYGRKTATRDGVTLKANVSVVYGRYDNRLLRLLSVLSSLDVLPTPSRLWDMIAYSFIVDWFLPVSDMLESFDAGIRTVVTKQYRTCRSVEATHELPVSMFVTSSQALETQLVAPIKYTYFQRIYEWLPSVPLPWLSADDVSASWSSMRLLVGAALLVQRL